MHKFIENIIGFSLKNHVFILFMTGVLFVAGIACYQNTPIEAYPDVTNTRAKIIAQWPGRSAEEVEKFVTLPIMQQLNTIPRKTDVRSTSLFGLAVVNVLFEDGVDDFYAQQYASNRIQELSLPDGVELSIEPPSGATGEIFRYILKSDLPIREVSAVNDWVVQRELLAVPGIATIATFGGEEKMYEIRVNPVELANYDISPLDVYEAVGRSNINVGGDVIQKGAQAYVVRGLGLLESVEDIENLLITTKGSSPIRVKEVATVSVSAKPRQGQVGLNYDDDVVQGIVIMLRGENPSEVITRLKDKITELNDRILPEDIKIVPFMDRTYCAHCNRKYAGGGSACVIYRVLVSVQLAYHGYCGFGHPSVVSFCNYDASDTRAARQSDFDGGFGFRAVAGGYVGDNRGGFRCAPAKIAGEGKVFRPLCQKRAYKEECRFGCFSYFLCSDYSGGGAVPYFLVSESGRKDVFSAGFYAWVCSSRLFAIVAYLCPCYVQGVVLKTDKREEQQGCKGIGGMAHFVLLLH